MSELRYTTCTVYIRPRWGYVTGLHKSSQYVSAVGDMTFPGYMSNVYNITYMNYSLLHFFVRGELCHVTWLQPGKVFYMLPAFLIKDVHDTRSTCYPIDKSKVNRLLPDTDNTFPAVKYNV